MNPEFRPQNTSATPRGWKQHLEGGDLIIVRPWRDLTAYALTPIGLVLTGITLALFRRTLGISPNHPAHFISIGLGLVTAAYVCLLLRRYLNQTRIHASADRIVVQHGPFPCWQSFDIDARQVRRLFVKELRCRYGGATAHFHELWMERTDGTEAAVVRGEMIETEAAYLQHQLQQVVRLAPPPAEFMHAPGPAPRAA